MFRRRNELRAPHDLTPEALEAWEAVAAPLAGRLTNEHALEVELAALLVARIRADGPEARAEDLNALGAVLRGLRG